MMRRPSFSDLDKDEQARFGNGVGPRWFPESWRRFLTHTASWFFCEASWRHHDFGYAVGGDRWDRARCDWQFLRAMLCDAVNQRHHWRIPPAILLSLIFYVAVRIGGRIRSFNYRKGYAPVEELRKLCR